MSRKKKSSRKGKQKKKTSPDIDRLLDRSAAKGKIFDLFRSRGKRTPVDEAQDLIYEAWDSPDPNRSVRLARQAIEISPDCADAYNFLAETVADSVEEAAGFYHKGVEAGERSLGKKVFKDSVGYFWGLLETRPYMRARQGLAQCLRNSGKVEEAAEHFQEILRLNPNDNQGIRYELIPWLFELNRDEEVGKLLKEYDDDALAALSYTRVLHAYRQNGDNPETRKLLGEALQGNEHVPSYLLGKRKLPRRLPEYHSFGDKSEAIGWSFAVFKRRAASAVAVPGFSS